MAFSFCLSHHQMALKINLLTSVAKHPTSTFALKAVNNEIYGVQIGYSLRTEWSFMGGSRAIVIPNLGRSDMRQRTLRLHASSKMFSKETTLASAWIHLLVVDLYAARQVYQDGLDNDIETRHSVSLCLLFCPIGILIHAITKALITTSRGSKTEMH
ncbi:Protein of unknown function DUF4281 [Cynara cardunculus var. scolymus]|uniref:Uncharacterized protein n=1 Tax=Cynara cardunculus var. scolymus TaxID=59895 RepID=A0A118K1H8_CYNCS|nr:Protein of unknown function DUF4281 [Cynara cardunculus var. scolymus]